MVCYWKHRSVYCPQDWEIWNQKYNLKVRYDSAASNINGNCHLVIFQLVENKPSKWWLQDSLGFRLINKLDNQVGSSHWARAVAQVEPAELIWNQWSKTHFIPFAQRRNICHVGNGAVGNNFCMGYWWKRAGRERRVLGFKGRLRAGDEARLALMGSVSAVTCRCTWAQLSSLFI